MSKLTLYAMLIILASVLVLAGCSVGVGYHSGGTTVAVAHEGHRHGPPPHAPAHGYRRNADGVILVYEASLGVYIVRDYRNNYYWEGHYYRCDHGSSWEVSVGIEGPWRRISVHRIPRGLQKRHGYKRDYADRD